VKDRLFTYLQKIYWQEDQTSNSPLW